MRVRIPCCRLFSSRWLAVLFLVVVFILYCYYYSNFQLSNGKDASRRLTSSKAAKLKAGLEYSHESAEGQKETPEYCPILDENSADINTVTTYPLFEFQPIWLRTKEFWDKSFEERYERLRNSTNRPKLKVIVVPHSHNDPGWLKTFEQYFEWKTKHIINNIVQKLHQYPNMTFIWTEISFLNAWWERSHPVKQKAFKKLIKEGRLEITTGGWVMPDEACTHIYSLIDQYVEGHIWVKNNLGTTPKIGWSIDPFGHGPTVPYLLDQSGLEGTVIQRIHYAWKQWLAEKQIEEFYWLPGWNTKHQPSLVVHNQPFDIYSIKSSCGPHPAICLGYDFRRIPGEYSEYSTKQQDITDENLHDKSRTLIEEYDRIGSLTTHNVVLVPLGDDFRYEYAVEFDAQYSNYMKMFEYINSHKDQFRAEVQFGTPLDYFNAVKERLKTIPTLKGDFFIYSDIFSEGKPAYWSGFYTTRPYLKILARQFEHQLRTAEILFSLVSNHIRQARNPKLVSSEKRLEKSYEQLINARRNLGLFQHHDAITGTSKANVMHDYGTKLFTSIYHCMRLQETALTSTLIPNEKLHSQNVLQSESEWETYGKPLKKMQITVADNKTIILFNPLVEPRTEVITITTNTTDVRVYDTLKKEYVLYQITPNIDLKQDGKHVISEDSFDVLFVASLPPLSAVTYTLERHVNRTNHCAVFCNSCQTNSGSQKFKIQKMMPGDIQLENSVLKLLIGRNTGFLRQIYRKDIVKRNVVEMQFSAYQSAQRHSGAYLFMPDYDYPERNVLASHSNSNAIEDENIVIVSGPISTEISSLYLPFLIHTVRIYNVNDYALSRGVYIESIVDFESPPKNRDTELFIRIQTDIQNGEVPEFYTDQNGFQYQKRVKVEKLGIEGNYYPITTMAWLQDEDSRLTWITNHAQGASSFEPGRLEVMLDRRTLYDDFRGIGEGVVDNKPTVFQNWLLLESVRKRNNLRTDHAFKNGPKLRLFTEKKGQNVKDTSYQLPSKTADYLSRSLNYPVNVYLLDTTEVGNIDIKSHQVFVENFPTGIHLVTLRTITDSILEQFPSSSCFMILQRPGYSCDVGEDRIVRSTKFSFNTKFTNLNYTNVTSVSLTGLKNYRNLNGLEEIDLEPMEIKTYKITF